MSYEVRLPVFEGPLDLLLHLLEREEVDIWDIPIVHITEQYLAYLQSMRELDLAVGGEFLVMAATLMQVKARTLLPRSPIVADGEELDLDPIEGLAIRLLQYRAFREIAVALQERSDQWGKIGFRPKVEHNLAIKYENPVGKVKVDDLWKCFQQLVKDRADAVRVRQVHRREVNLSERMGEILLRLRVGRHTVFSQLISKQPTREELVVTFLAILELVRRGRVQAVQYGNFSDIQLNLCAEHAGKGDEDDATGRS